MEYADVGRQHIAYRREGAGPALVLLHGAVSDSRVWRALIENLSDDFTVIAWDAPGCGQSSDPPESWRMPEYADCLAGFLDAIGIDDAHALGHSWGSTLALELYRRHRSRATSMVLVGAYAGWAGSLPEAEGAARLRFALDVADRLPDGFDPRSMRGLFSDVMPEERVEELMTVMSEIRPAATRVMAYGLAEADQRDVLGHITVPVLLVYGDQDERSDLSVARSLAAAIPTSTLVVMPGLGHECYLESTASFAQEVRTFLRHGDELSRASARVCDPGRCA